MAHSPRAKSSCWLKISTQHTKDAQVKWCSTQQCGPVKSNYGPVLNHMYQTRSLEVDQLLHMWHARWESLSMNMYGMFSILASF